MLTKLRAILLMEADFNHSNKEIFGFRMLENARKYEFIPEEVYSERSKTVDDGTLAKVLFQDFVRQTRLTSRIHWSTQLIVMSALHMLSPPWYSKHTVFQKKRCSQCYLQSKR